MTSRNFCDGCGTEIGIILPLGPGQRELVVSGSRVNNMCGGGLPNGRFDWCDLCAVAAFAALRGRRLESQ